MVLKGLYYEDLDHLANSALQNISNHGQITIINDAGVDDGQRRVLANMGTRRRRAGGLSTPKMELFVGCKIPSQPHQIGTETEPYTYASPSHVAYRLTFTLIVRIIVPLEGRQ